jgi:hypothetical protein
MVEKGTFVHCTIFPLLVAIVILKNSMEFPQIIKNDSVIPLLGINPKDLNTM